MTLARDTRQEATASPDEADRPRWPAIRRGFAGRCPQCGEGKIFRAYLKVNDACPSCGEEFHHQRADDAPPYLTIFIVGHVVAAMLMIADDQWPQLDMWIHMILWPLVAILMSLWLLPGIKGALISYQWALRMHGFATTLPSVASRSKP
ncbi:MAG: DUF983 domain-containing protein, partial [Beijerinckiaceae bacterium]|nr:DUF983 domain-containing protein [Beijerinckiaceae bacterium]